MTTPLVSIVMPVFEPHPVYFRQAIDSILSQLLSSLVKGGAPDAHVAAAMFAMAARHRTAI